MALKDLFDSDKRSKDELRLEIEERERQLESIHRDLAALRAEINVRRSSDIPLPPASLDEVPGQEANALKAEIQFLLNQIADQQRAIDEFSSTKNKLEKLVEELDASNRTTARELENERRLRIADNENDSEKYQRIFDARHRVTQSDQLPVEIEPELSPAPIIPADQVPTPFDEEPSPAHPTELEAHRDLVQRQENVEALERKFDELLARFGITDKAQIISLPARLAEIEQELAKSLKVVETQEIISLRRKVDDANALVKKRAEERDELGRLLSQARARIAASHEGTLRQQLDSAQIEIKRLKDGTSDEVWSLKGRLAEAEKEVQDREFQIRNLKLRLETLERVNPTLEAANSKLKFGSISLDDHRAECNRLKQAVTIESNRVDDYRKQIAAVQRELRTATAQINQLRHNLDAEKKGRKNLPVAAVREESIFANPIVLRWLLEAGDPGIAEVPNGWLGRIGEGPWSGTQLQDALEIVGYEFWRTPDSDLRHLVVGRKNWTGDDLIEQIEAVEGGSLRIYSQEMFFAKLMTGRDPFDADDDDLLHAFAKGHPALEFLLKLPEPWPTVCNGDSQPIDQVDRDDYGVAESPLHLLGYHVGSTSQLTTVQRHKVLAECFKANNLKFTDESSDDYRRKWGRGGSAQRLYRMAVHIKWLADGQGKDPRKPLARRDWTNDLEWLRKTYHSAIKQRFHWP